MHWSRNFFLVRSRKSTQISSREQESNLTRTYPFAQPTDLDDLTMAAVSKHVQLALSLPPRLRTFFARYPPAAIMPAGAKPTAYQEESPNPFQSTKHPVTGKFHDPKYSLRRQAELAKLARAHGVEELLPFTSKKADESLRRRVELGLRVKGHIHERQMLGKYVHPDFPIHSLPSA